VRYRWLVILWLLPAPGRAQTADALLGGWSWRPRELGSRPAGLAGAYVAVADSVRTVSLNPAGLSLIPHAELAASTADRWIGLGYARHAVARAGTPRPTEPGAPAPCPPGAASRPWAVALFAEQAVRQRNVIEVVHAPGIAERGEVEAHREEIGVSVAKGITPWLNVGLTVAWHHMRMDGRSTTLDPMDRELQVLTISGDSNKARAGVGVLATFGPGSSPTALRIGVAYRRDLLPWEVERTVLDRARGVVASGPALVDIEEPPILSGGAAWRLSDQWLVTGQVDYIWYDRVRRALARNSGSAERFQLEDAFEPRVGIELTRPSPFGGYYKVRAGARRESAGRLAFEGTDPPLTQAFRGSPRALRASVGVSILAEFYDTAARFDFDISQVAVERRRSLSPAGGRRYSFGLTVRL
jgi:hypothetical protein